MHCESPLPWLNQDATSTLGALIISYTIFGAPFCNYSIILGTKTLFSIEGLCGIILERSPKTLYLKPQTVRAVRVSYPKPQTLNSFVFRDGSWG